MNLGFDPKIYGSKPPLPTSTSETSSINYGLMIGNILKLIVVLWFAYSALILITRDTEFALKDVINWAFYNSTVFIHEAGHIIFMPVIFLQTVPIIGGLSQNLGNYLISLGGPLTQVGVPLIFMIYFGFRKKFFSFSFCLYWFSNTLHQSTSYIADALCVCSTYFSPFAGFLSGEDVKNSHDWVVLLTPLGLLPFAIILSKIVLGISVLLFIASIVLMFLDVVLNFLKSFEKRDLAQQILSQPNLPLDKPIIDTSVINPTKPST